MTHEPERFAWEREGVSLLDYYAENGESPQFERVQIVLGTLWASAEEIGALAECSPSYATKALNALVLRGDAISSERRLERGRRGGKRVRVWRRRDFVQHSN